MSTEKIMEQAQVFASAWSVVGGPFDGGDAMEVATQEKDELRRMVGALAAERDATAAKLAAAQGMADTMAMLRSEMIESGVIDASVAPMFFPESIIPRLRTLAELEGQEPVAWYADIEDWGREYNGRPELSNGVIGKPLYARPVSAEPVNTRLLDALKYAAGCLGTDGNDPIDLAIAEAEAQQERLLQDMHDAGREIDRVMAGAAQKAVRLTDAEIGVIDRQSREGLKASLSTWPISLAHDIETAFAAKNGIEVAE